MGTSRILILAMGMVLAACQREDTHPAVQLSGSPSPAGPSYQDSHYLDLLVARGFDTLGVRKFSDGYVVEGDIFIPKTDLDSKQVLSKKAQRQIGSVSAVNANKIRIQIHSSLAAWHAEAQQAINIWNSVGSNVYLNIVTSNPHILMASDNSSALPSSHRNHGGCGFAGFPSGGLPFKYVSIAMSHVTLTERKQRVLTMVHEIGHTIGLAHTNTSDGTHIPGTPTTDNASIMGWGVCGAEIYSLSEWDRKALLMLYPKDMPLFGMRTNDGDNREDLVVFRPSDATWYIKQSSSGFTTQAAHVFGGLGVVPIPKTDFDGDRLADLVAWNPVDGYWNITTSSSGYLEVRSYQWGSLGDIPLSGMDIDRDGKDDLAVWRWTDGTFYFKLSSYNYTMQTVYQMTGAGSSLGLMGIIPVPDTDLDRDGWDDIVYWNPATGNWTFLKSSTGFDYNNMGIIQWGTRGDIPVPGADNEGDGYDELMVWRPTNGTMYTKTSSSNYADQRNIQIGTMGDVPLSDINIGGDSRKDLSVWRRTGGNWIFKVAPLYFDVLTYQWGT